MASFNDAKCWLLNGEKICRPSWKKNSYWSLGSAGVIIYSDGEPAKVHINQTNAYDWEIWKEKKTLSDEKESMGTSHDFWYKEDKVKQFIRELKESEFLNGGMLGLINEKAGPGLI